MVCGNPLTQLQKEKATEMSESSEYLFYECDVTIAANYTDNNTEYYIDETELTLAFQVGHFLTYYYTPGMIAVGSLGNILSVIVFLNTKLKKLSSSYYLAAMCISDTGFLWSSLFPWLNYVGGSEIKKNSPIN